MQIFRGNKQVTELRLAECSFYCLSSTEVSVKVPNRSRPAKTTSAEVRVTRQGSELVQRPSSFSGRVED